MLLDHIRSSYLLCIVHVLRSQYVDRLRIYRGELLIAVKGLYVVTDLFPFHLQARKVGLTVMTCLTMHIEAVLSVAQPLDDGFHHLPIPVTICLWIHGGSHEVYGMVSHVNNEY